MANQITLMQVLDSNGDPVAGTGNVKFYDEGTTTPREVFEDEGLATSLGTSVDTDAGGRASSNPVYVASGTGVKVVYESGGGVTLETLDPVPFTATSTTAAGGVTFAPITGNTATDVQAAIERNTALIAAVDAQLPDTIIAAEEAIQAASQFFHVYASQSDGSGTLTVPVGRYRVISSHFHVRNQASLSDLATTTGCAELYTSAAAGYPVYAVDGNNLVFGSDAGTYLTGHLNGGDTITIPAPTELVSSSGMAIQVVRVS